MFNVSLHKTVLISLLKEVYRDPELRTALGFKGGTAALLFYDLPRYSVDLDFDLLDESKKDIVLRRMPGILKKSGEVVESLEKRFTLFFLLNYQKKERNVKVEISKRPTSASYEVKQYLGIPILIMKKEDLAATKLAALLTRVHFASRDMFDLWFYLKNMWQINEKTLRDQTGLSLQEAVAKAIEKICGISQNQLLQGLGELLTEQQKRWVKEKLRDELVFQLGLYKETHT